MYTFLCKACNNTSTAIEIIIRKKKIGKEIKNYLQFFLLFPGVN